MSSEPEYAVENQRIDSRAGVPLFADAEETLVSMQEVVGRKWHPVIVYHLLDAGPQGFGSLKERVDGISSKMLSDSLETLEAAGVVDRTVLDDRPVRVEYALTERGEALEPLITEMINWGTENETALDPQAETDEADGTPAEPRVEGT